MKSKKLIAGREGFTLAEMLVAIALLAILAAVVVPAIVSQVGKGDSARVVSDLTSVSNAAKTYYIENRAWPATIDELVEANLLDYPGYMADSLRTGGGGRILDTISDSSNVLILKVSDLAVDVGNRVVEQVGTRAIFDGTDQLEFRFTK